MWKMICAFCQTRGKTVAHLLWGCGFTRLFWSDFCSWIVAHVGSVNLGAQLIFGGRGNFIADSVWLYFTACGVFHVRMQISYQQCGPQFRGFLGKLLFRCGVEGDIAVGNCATDGFHWS